MIHSTYCRMISIILLMTILYHQLVNQFRADQNMGGTLLESPMRTDMHRKSHILSAISVELNCLQYLFAIISKISDGFPSVAVAKWVRHWSSNHRVVQAEGSSPHGDVYQFFFSNDFYFTFISGLMDFSDIAILCSRPNSCCQQNQNILMSLYNLFSLGLFL